MEPKFYFSSLTYLYNSYILTDVRKLLITLDDETDNLLQGEQNQNETVRKAVRLYKSDITTDTLEGIRLSYKIITKALKEIDSKIDYLAGKL